MTMDTIASVVVPVRTFGGFQDARLIYFGGMVVIVGFLVVHFGLALLVPSLLWAMVTGGPLVARGVTVQHEAIEP